MKKIVFLTLSLLLAVSFWNCEKDDICAEGTPVTPRLIIEFYDAANPTVLKNVTNLGIIEPTFTEGIPFNGVSKIEVPLRTNSTTTTLNFIENGGDTTDTSDDNPDAITFNYATSNVYISRACGYKTIFQLDPTNPIVLSPDAANWIQNIVVSQPNIENENEVHVKIYF
jgi:hypothetical protein